MKTKPRSKRWLQILDLIGMILAPISVSLPFFFLANLSYQNAKSTGTSYTNAIALFFGALGMLILLGFYFGRGFKLYVNPATREKIKDFRSSYSIFILGSLMVYFMIFYAFFFGRVT